MKQKNIDFRELLERLLPLEELTPTDRRHVDHALRAGVTTQLEQAAFQTLQALERKGALRRLPGDANGGGPVVRYQPRDRLDVITIHLPSPRERQGILAVPRTGLPGQAQAGLDQVRRLLLLDDALLARETSPSGVPGEARGALLEQLQQIGRDFLGASEVRFVPLGPGGDPAEGSFDVELAREAIADVATLYYCADLGGSPRLEPRARRLGARSAVIAGVTTREGVPLGHLEVLAADAEAFRPDDLAMIALLADHCAAVLQRATRIEKLVFVDPLTSAYNRSYFDLQMQNEMARAQREQASLALCIADIDNFKSFNSAFGYEAGNQVLIQVAETLRRGVRPFDTVARWGGEEFAVLLTSPVVAEDVVMISERLRSLVERQAVRVEGLDRRAHHVGVTVSIGVALFPDHATDAQDLWRAANQALLLAKRPPKNRVVFFQPSGT